MNTPVVIERTSSGTTGISLESALLEKRIIFVDKPISTETANEIIKQILVLSAVSTEKIILLINTPGGDIQSGLALIDCMKACPCDICTVSLGMAASMGAVLLAAGTKGMRYVTKHSRVMLHEPLIQNGAGGSCSSIQATAEALLERKKLINKLLCSYTGKKASTINKATSYDNYMNSEQALQLGMVDEILEGQALYKILKGE